MRADDLRRGDADSGGVRAPACRLCARRIDGHGGARHRASPDGEEDWVDLIARLGDTFGLANLESEVVVVEGVPIRMATPRMLYRMKHDTVRPQDRADAARLKERFGLEDE